MRRGELPSRSRFFRRTATLEGQRGFTLVWTLAAVAVLSVGLALVGPLWSQQARRATEQELLRIGLMYATAIKSYRAAAPGSLKQYPQSLELLVLDTRFAGTVRHLRKLYVDPLDPTRPWGLILDSDGGIMGVYSRSVEAPMHTEALDLGIVSLPAASRYEAWKFVVRSEQ